MVSNSNKISSNQDDSLKNNPLDLTSLPENLFTNLQILYNSFSINHLLIGRIKEKVLPLKEKEKENKVKLL